ncbi:MFS general substrate transporter [Mollisia scopiformis]|uniref:MFS general substrate transporter n=1 Tax=Mollisia scopiformis TaxID=149040 RepID=A0A194XBH2_MOLSC|nr:MFS general substrate transporter [Mollisia scopiformis]KUJ17511.1 MFS general substrate transporter [Mollisia scopiformis]
MEASSKPKSASIDVESGDAPHSNLKNSGSSLNESPREIRSDTSLREANIDPITEAAFLKRMDYRMVPLLFLLYMMSYLDRSNIGNAKIAGMSKDLHFSTDGNDYSWLLTIFYLAYILFEPFILLWRVIPAHILVPIMVSGWGLVATLQSAVNSWSALMALRFLLGMFEAGVGPGIPLYLAYFYQRHEIGLRLGFILSAGPLATCFAGALAYGITSGHPSIANWRLLLLVEGLPCFILAAVAWFYLPDSPASAKFLRTEEDQNIVSARGIRQVGAAEAGHHGKVGPIVWSEVGAGVLNPRNYITALMYFSCNVSFSSLPVFLPTIITEMGFSAIHAQGLSAPPYFIAVIFVLISTYFADRYGQRGIVICISALIGAAGYIVQATTTVTAIRYFGVYLAASGIYSAIINVIPWMINNHGTDTKRGAGLVIMGLVGQCGPVLGTRIYPANDEPYYRMGMWTCASFMILVAVLSIALRTVLKWENSKLDAKYGKLENGGGRVGMEAEGPNFRYVL